MNTRLNWSYKATTTLTGKLLQTWEQKGMAMAHNVAYLIKVYKHNLSTQIKLGYTLYPLEEVGHGRQEGLNMFRFWELKTKDKLL
jgi:hypothetical protein